MAFWVSLSEIFRNIGLVIGGAIGIYLAWKRVVASDKQANAQLRQAELSRRGHVAELFNRAVSQLNDAKLEVRLGAIVTLESVCTDFVDRSAPVIELLTRYLRERTQAYGETDPPAEIETIMGIIATVLNPPAKASKTKPPRIDLSHTFIRRTDLSGANLKRANFSNADCTNAIFQGANFKDAILEGTILKGADLSETRNLTSEQLSRAIIDETTILPTYLR